MVSNSPCYHCTKYNSCKTDRKDKVIECGACVPTEPFDTYYNEFVANIKNLFDSYNFNHRKWQVMIMRLVIEPQESEDKE